jgi:hypothetical protein
MRMNTDLWRNDFDGKKPKLSENNLFYCCFVHHKSHMHGPWIESRQDFKVRGRRLTAVWSKRLVYIIRRMLVPALWGTIAGGFIGARVCVISLLDLQVPYPKEVNYLLFRFHILFITEWLYGHWFRRATKNHGKRQKNSHRLVRDSTPGFFTWKVQWLNIPPRRLLLLLLVYSIICL